MLRLIRYKALSILASLIIFPAGLTPTANAAPLINFECFQEDESRRLGSVTISCYLEHPWSEDGVASRLQVSSDGMNWKQAPTSDRYIGAESGPCARNYGQIFDTNESESHCYYLDYSYEPSKTGKITLRASASISGKSFTSNSVTFEVSEEILDEQEENRINDAKNKVFKLKVNWPDRFQVGKSKSLKIMSNEKYSGSCAIRSRSAGQVEFKFFEMRKGMGAVYMRGLKKGAVATLISCTQSSGGGPFAISEHIIYFY